MPHNSRQPKPSHSGSDGPPPLDPKAVAMALAESLARQLAREHYERLATTTKDQGGTP